MATAAIPGLNFGPEVTYILAAILIITGLALAFYGHGLWTTVMSMIGALLGSAVGFLFGAALSSNIAVGLVLALGLYLLSAGTLTAGLAGLGVFLLGALVQTATIKKKQRARTRAAVAPPPPPPPPSA